MKKLYREAARDADVSITIKASTLINLSNLLDHRLKESGGDIDSVIDDAYWVQDRKRLDEALAQIQGID